MSIEPERERAVTAEAEPASQPKRQQERVYPDLVAYFKDHPEESAYLVAKELGISSAFLSMIKWRIRQPPLPLALKMMERFRVPLESLIRTNGGE